MASFDPISRMDENAFRAPEKMQSKAGRRPLGDVTNSSKPLAKNKSSANIFTEFKAQQKVKAPKAGRKPLGDLTNSNKPRANEKSSKKNCIETLSAVNEEQFPCCQTEGFLHNHDECIKAQQQAMTMSLDYFLETVALKEDPSDLVFTSLSKVTTPTDSELKTSLDFDELELQLMDDVSPPTPPSLKSPSAPKSPTSPGWSTDWANLELSPLKLKESPVKN